MTLPSAVSPIAVADAGWKNETWLLATQVANTSCPGRTTRLDKGLLRPPTPAPSGGAPELEVGELSCCVIEGCDEKAAGLSAAEVCVASYAAMIDFD